MFPSLVRIQILPLCFFPTAPPRRRWYRIFVFNYISADNDFSPPTRGARGYSITSNTRSWFFFFRTTKCLTRKNNLRRTRRAQQKLLIRFCLLVYMCVCVYIICMQINVTCNTHTSTRIIVVIQKHCLPVSRFVRHHAPANKKPNTHI